MSSYGYGYAPRETLLSFREQLDEGEWKLVDITAYYDANRKLPEKLAELPLLVSLKLVAVYSIEDLLEAIALANSNSTVSVDRQWDSLQKRLFTRLSLVEDEGTDEEQALAQRLRLALFPKGLSHTQFEFEKEIKFGKSQIMLARSKELFPLLQRLSLDQYVDLIEQKTTEFEDVLEASGSQAPSLRISRAQSSCAATLADVHATLDRLSPRAATKAATEQFNELRAPFEAMLASIQAPPKKEPAPSIIVDPKAAD